MSLNFQDFDVFATEFSGVLGAMVSIRYLQGSWKARISTATSGAFVAYYATPYLSTVLGAPEGLMGFLVGMFGMAIVSRTWEALQMAPIPALWQAVLDRVRGKPR
jgi:hypothetical protein